MPAKEPPPKAQGAKNSSEYATDKYHKKLQRILRSSDGTQANLSGGLSPNGPGRMSERNKAATLAPKLVDSVSVPQDEGPLFQCTECDMIVKESDPYCPFCGAIFADGTAATDEGPEAEEEKPTPPKPVPERPANREPVVHPDKFDLFSLVRTKSRSKDLLYQEALKGFQGSARLLDEIEHLVSDIGSLGRDTSSARKLIGSAWEACRDGDYNTVSTLARQTEAVVAPSIPDLVRSEIAKARGYLMEAKAVGIDISQYVLRIKSAMQALHDNDVDEALRITKELMDSMREDSIAWN